MFYYFVCSIVVVRVEMGSTTMSMNGTVVIMSGKVIFDGCFFRFYLLLVSVLFVHVHPSIHCHFVCGLLVLLLLSTVLFLKFADTPEFRRRIFEFWYFFYAARLSNNTPCNKTKQMGHPQKGKKERRGRRKEGRRQKQESNQKDFESLQYLCMDHPF